MRVKIISDSTCDLSPALLERYDIAVTPLCVIKDGKDFHDGVDLTPADIFAHVDGGGDLCSTSAVSQYEYGEMFARYANEYDAVVQITIGANFSCCYQNACAAAQEYENVVVVDSENLSSGQGLLDPAADLALLGLYLPLLVADPIVLKRYERPQRERVRTALRKGIITSLGYILMLLLISGLREFLGAGALMGTQVMKNALFPMAQLPSGGFILLALVMCVWRAAAASVKQQMSLGAEHL